jgi:hypothetical protein
MRLWLSCTVIVRFRWANVWDLPLFSGDSGQSVIGYCDSYPEGAVEERSALE